MTAPLKQNASVSDSSLLIRDIVKSLPALNGIKAFGTLYLESISSRSLQDRSTREWADFLKDRFDFFSHSLSNKVR